MTEGTVTPQATESSPGIESHVSEATKENDLTKPLDFKGTKHKIKVYDQEEELDYDELLKRAQKSSAADAKWQESAKLRKEAADKLKVFEEFEKDPWNYMKQKGMNPEEWAENLLLEKLKFDQMSPTEKELVSERKKREAIEQELASKTEKEKELLRGQYEQQASKEIDDEITAVLKETGKKPTPRLIAEIAMNMLAHHESGGGKLTAKDAYNLARKNIDLSVNEFISELSVEDAFKTLPKKLLDGIIKHELDNRISQNPYNSGSRRTEGKEQPINPKNKAMSTDDYFNRLEKKLGVK